MGCDNDNAVKTSDKGYAATILKARKSLILNYIMQTLTLLYGGACLWLFYHQSVADLTVAGEIPYQADLPLHISMIVDDGWYYSFTAYAYKFLHVICGGSTIGIAILLAVCAYLTVPATDRLLTLLWKEPKEAWYTRLVSLTLNFVMPIFISSVGEFRYVSYQAANIWHNSTYTCMRLFALLTFTLYLKLEKKYREGITAKEWCLFALLNAVTTGIKPSFLLAYSPIVGLFLLVDLIKKVPLKRILVFGSALLPSGLVILWQNAVLFGSDTGNGIGFDPWYTFSLHAAVPKLAVVCSAAFCGAVILCTCRDMLKDRQYLFITLMSALGFLEALCLTELGSRAVDGNFLWGYSFCLSVLFAVCAVKWLEMAKRSAVKIAAQLGLALLYGWHLYCGIYFFTNLVVGATYWMK